MERGFPHPQGRYHGRGAGPWFTETFQHFPQRGHFSPWSGHNHQNSQRYPVPWRGQYQAEQPSRDFGCGFGNDSFLHQGSGFYRRRSRGRVYGKCSSSFYKARNSSSLKGGKDSYRNSSHVLVTVQSKKESDSEVKKDESIIPKETKQVQEDSVASVENTDPPQVSQEASKATISASRFSFHLPPASCTMCSPTKTENTEQVSEKASKAVISPSQFSFHLPLDSLTCPVCGAAKTEDTELINLGTGFKTEDGHKVACCAQAVPSELPSPLENLELKKEEEEIELDKLKDSQATEAPPSQATSLPSAKAPVERQAPSDTAGSFHPVVKEEPMPAPEARRSPVASFASGGAPTGKQAPSETMKDSCPVIKKEPDTEAHCCQAASPPSDETRIRKQVQSEVTESIHPMVKEEPLPVSETKQDMNTASVIDPSPITEPSVPSCIVEPPAPLETREALLSPGREDELTQMGGSHKDIDYLQACDALAGGSSALPVIPSAVHSVPVLVRRKETEQPYFWESESSPHAQNFNWSDGGRGWAPEDYQEPSWGVEKAKRCGDVSERDRHLVLCHSSFHFCHSCDQNPDTGRVLECHSSSPKSHHSSDSKHSSTQRTTKCLRSSPIEGHHPRSPLRQRWRSRSPLRQDRSHSSDSRSPGEREIIRTAYCNKCHCKCCQNPSRERLQEKELPYSYSTCKMHRCYSSRESSKSYRTSHPHSSEKSMMTRKRKSTCCEETKKGRSTSVKKRKSSKVNKKGRKVLAPVNHDAPLAVETSILSETTEHVPLAKTEEYESGQLAASGEDTDFPHKPCAGQETGTSAPSKIAEDPRSEAVLTKRDEIEQDYLQVVLNFAVVATMLLQKEPCMEQALEVALRANMRSVGDYYESMLKSFIDDYDLSKTC